jgi:hypothetical protein
MTITPKELFYSYPVEFSIYIRYMKSLIYDEEPDYQFLRKAFQDYFDNQFSNNLILDWTIYKYDKNKLVKARDRIEVLD